VFEGAQGVLLDEWRGFHPYTTLDMAARYPLRLCRAYHVDGQRLSRITPDRPGAE